MCLLILAHQVSARCPLVVAANRDEFHARPTALSEFWEEHPMLLAGKDLQLGGTWMGITRAGRFAAITNFRDPTHTPAAPLSRGNLPLHYLAQSQSPRSYLDSVAAHAQEYAGFNLLIGDRDTLWYFSNSGGADNWGPRQLPPGIYGLSNAQLDTPWPKVKLGKAKLLQLLDAGHWSHEDLSEVVSDQHPADPHALRLQGMDSEMEQLLSAQFITTKDYGTRSTTTLWTDHNATASWCERSFNANGTLADTREQTFPLDSM